MVTLYDHRGQKIERAQLKETQSAPSLRSVRQVFSSSPSHGLTPQKLAGILSRADRGDPHAQCELFEDMEEKDLHLSSVLSTRKRAVIGLEIKVEAPLNASAQEQKATDLLTEHLAALEDLPEQLEDVLDAIGKGYSVTEIIWGIHKQEAVIEDLQWREPKWFRFDMDSMSELRMLDPSSAEGLELTPYKYIRHIHKAKSGIPVRGGILRPCAWMYLFKNYSFKDWVQFAEVYAQPLRVGKYPSSASESEKDILLQAVANMGTDAAAIIPDSMLIEFVEAGGKGSSTDLYERMCRFCDEQVSKGVLGQTSSSDAMAGGLGSGQANLHGDVRDDLLKADARLLSGTLSRDLARPIIDLNMGPLQRYPKIRVVVEDAEDLKELSDNVSKLHAIGLPIGEDFLYQKFNIPKPEHGENLVGASLSSSPKATTSSSPKATTSSSPKASPSSSPKASMGEPSSQIASNAQQDTGQTQAATMQNHAPDAVETIAERLHIEAQTANDAIIQQVRGLLNDVETLEEFSQRLPELLGNLDTAAITEIMAKAFVVADLAGQSDVLDESQS